DELRRFIARRLVNQVLLPMLVLALRILVPIAGSAWEANDDVIGPAIAVDVIGPAAKALAVAVESVAEIPKWLTDFMHLPIRRFVPNLTGENIHPAVLVHIRDGDALRPE